MPGTPATTPVHGAPRASNADTFDFARDVNGVADRFDITAMRLDTGLASARPGTGPGTGAWYYATDTRQLSRWNGTTWETNAPNAHAASHQDGGTDALTTREAMNATGALGDAKGAFHAYRNAAASLATGAVVVFDTDSGAGAFDVSNWFDVTTGRFTPQVAGYYSLSWLATTGSFTVDKFWLTQLRKNGVVYADGNVTWMRTAGSFSRSGGSANAQANGTTDFFDVVIANDLGVNAAITNALASTYFCGELIGRS